MRLLIVDESGLLAWVASQLGGSELEVQRTSSFDDAMRVVREAPPAAAIVSITGAEVPWHAFQALCNRQDPPVPVLYESCAETRSRLDGCRPNGGYLDHVTKPVDRGAFAAAFERLLTMARRREALAAHGAT